MEALQALVPFALVLLLFLVLVILPAKRHRLRMQALLDQVKVGDEVMMQSGQYGQVTALDAETVFLQISEGVVTRWNKAAISMVVGTNAVTEKSSPAVQNAGVNDPTADLSDSDSKVSA